MKTLYFTPQRKKKDKIKTYADYLKESHLPERVKKYWLKESELAKKVRWKINNP